MKGDEGFFFWNLCNLFSVNLIPPPIEDFKIMFFFKKKFCCIGDKLTNRILTLRSYSKYHHCIVFWLLNSAQSKVRLLINLVRAPRSTDVASLHFLQPLAVTRTWNLGEMVVTRQGQQHADNQLHSKFDIFKLLQPYRCSSSDDHFGLAWHPDVTNSLVEFIETAGDVARFIVGQRFLFWGGNKKFLIRSTLCETSFGHLKTY